jgi:hypothetical protein
MLRVGLLLAPGRARWLPLRLRLLLPRCTLRQHALLQLLEPLGPVCDAH